MAQAYPRYKPTLFNMLGDKTPNSEEIKNRSPGGKVIHFIIILIFLGFAIALGFLGLFLALYFDGTLKLVSELIPGWGIVIIAPILAPPIILLLILLFVFLFYSVVYNFLWFLEKVFGFLNKPRRGRIGAICLIIATTSLLLFGN